MPPGTVPVENRYAGEEKQRLAEIMGSYFSDNLLQPLTLNGHNVWFPQAMVNKRRCDEAAHHLLEVEAKMLLEAEKERMRRRPFSYLSHLILPTHFTAFSFSKLSAFELQLSISR
jgi:hypothetical protein